MIKIILKSILISLLYIQMIFADVTTKALIDHYDYLEKRHEVIATNIANISTPKYNAHDLEQPASNNKDHKIKIPKVQIRITNAKHLKSNKQMSTDGYKVTNDNSGAMKPNKNNVDLSKQVTKIATNSDETSWILKNYRSSMDLIASASDSAGGNK